MHSAPLPRLPETGGGFSRPRQPRSLLRARMAHGLGTPCLGVWARCGILFVGVFVSLCWSGVGSPIRFRWAEGLFGERRGVANPVKAGLGPSLNLLPATRLGGIGGAGSATDLSGAPPCGEAWKLPDSGRGRERYLCGRKATAKAAGCTHGGPKGRFSFCGVGNPIHTLYAVKYTRSPTKRHHAHSTATPVHKSAHPSMQSHTPAS